MTTKVDLALKMSESLGKHLPTLYVDFVDVSYGVQEGEEDTDDIIDAASEYSRYSQDPNSGTYVNGSLSIYLTKETSESNENLADWVREQLGDLYIYAWLSPYQALNEDVKRGVLDLKQLFYAMTPDKRSTFDSNSPSYDAIIAEMKDAFLGNGWHASGHKEWHRKWITATTYTDTAEEDTSFLLANIDTPGHWVYDSFWGPDGKDGPWRKVEGKEDDWGAGDYINAGYSYMNVYLARTLYSYTGGGTGQKYTSGRRMNAYKLSDYIAADGSNVRTEGLYDQTGDQISVIVNLPIDFNMSRMEDDMEWADAEYGNKGDSISYRLARLSSIYLIACVGNDVLINNEAEDDDGNALYPGELTDSFKEMNSLLFNANFGDITYEPIFSSPTGADGTPSDLQIADQKADIFVSEATGSPHPGEPIMSINGTYHADTPMGHAKIVSTMTQLIDNYADKIDTDRQLKRNLANIAHILASKDYTTDILRRLQFFRKTFVDKASPGNSGKLYRAFNKLLYSANRQVLKQPRLKKVRVVNNKIIDSRVKAPNVSYVNHGGTGNAVDSAECTAGGPGSTYCKYYAGMAEIEGDSAYIPKNWHYMTRRTVHTIPINGRELLTDMAQFILEEGAPKYFIDSDYYTYGGNASEGIPEEGSVWAEYMSDFAAGRAAGAGYTLGAQVTTTDEGEDGTNYLGTATGVGAFDSVDVVVKNDGIFFFDYEKAIHTHSKLSFVLAPHRIQKYLGLHVPYEYFRVKTVKLKRAENRFLTNMGEEYFDDAPKDDEEPEKVNIVQTLYLDDDVDYPSPDYSTYEGFVTDGDGKTPNYRYGQPTVRLASTVDSGDLASITMEDPMDALSQYAGDATYEMFTGGTDSLSGETGTAYSFKERLPGMAALPGGHSDNDQRYAGQLEDLAQRYMATIETDSTKEVPSYLRLVNFDAPLGTRAGPQSFVSYARADSTNRPSGQLTNYEGWIVRGGYRVMCFEYNDYMDDDVAYYNTIGRSDFEIDSEGGDDLAAEFGELRAELPPTKYEVEIEVEDQSLRMMQDIYKIFSDEFDHFVGNYYNHAIASCSYNNIDDRFNDFFANGINSSYPSPDEKPWIRAPYVFNIARTLLFKTFEDEDTYNASPAEAMREQAAKVAKLIGPEDGRLMHLKRFKIDFEKLLNVIKPRSESDTETTLSGRRLFGSKAGGHSAGTWDTPLFNYHPVYDRTLQIAGTEAGDAGTDSAESTYEDDNTIEKLWEDACSSTHTYVFKNSFPIDQEIYGDMFLSSLYTWNYTPPTTTIEYDEIFDFLKSLGYVTKPKGKIMADLSLTTAQVPEKIYGLYDRIDALPPANTYDASSWNHYPPGKRTQASIPMGFNPGNPSNWHGYVDQALLCCFVYKFRDILEKGLHVETGRLDTVTFEDISDHIIEIATAGASYGGDRAIAEAALSEGLGKLQNGYELISYEGSVQNNKARRLFNANVWTQAGISAICNFMQPILVYGPRDEYTHADHGTTFGHSRPSVLYNHMRYDNTTSTGGTFYDWSTNNWSASDEQSNIRNGQVYEEQPYTGWQIRLCPPPRAAMGWEALVSGGGFKTHQWGRQPSYSPGAMMGKLNQYAPNAYRDPDLTPATGGHLPGRYVLNFEKGIKAYMISAGHGTNGNADRFRYADYELCGTYAIGGYPDGWEKPGLGHGGVIVVPPGADPGDSGFGADDDGDGVPDWAAESACVIATHAMSTGMFKTEDRANAVDWCTNKLHGKWWGEIMRRGYRYLGRKHIANGTAELVYDEFKECLEWANGKRPFELRIASRYTYRVIQTFIVGLFVKENE